MSPILRGFISVAVGLFSTVLIFVVLLFAGRVVLDLIYETEPLPDGLRYLLFLVTAIIAFVCGSTLGEFVKKKLPPSVG